MNLTPYHSHIISNLNVDKRLNVLKKCLQESAGSVIGGWVEETQTLVVSTGGERSPIAGRKSAHECGPPHSRTRSV